MANQTSELVRMRDEQVDKGAEHTKLKSVRDALTFSWPHQRAGRTRVCETVMKIANIHESITKINEELEAGKALAVTDPAKHTHLETLENDKQKLLSDESSLLLQLKGVDVAKMNYSGKRNASLPDNELSTIARKVYGKETLQQLAMSIRAATLKVFVESGQQASAFSVNDPDVRTSIVEQLGRWGIQAGEGVLCEHGHQRALLLVRPRRAPGYG